MIDIIEKNFTKLPYQRVLAENQSRSPNSASNQAYNATANSTSARILKNGTLKTLRGQFKSEKRNKTENEQLSFHFRAQSLVNRSNFTGKVAETAEIDDFEILSDDGEAPEAETTSQERILSYPGDLRDDYQSGKKYRKK